MRNTKQKKGGLYNFFSVAPKPDATAPAKTSSASTAAPCMDLTDDEPLILSSSSSNLIDLTDDDLFIPGRHLPSSSQQSDRMQIDSDPRPVARTVDTPVIEMASSNKYRINSSSQPIRTKPLYSSQEKPRWSPSSISHSQSDSRPRQEIQRRATVKPPPFMPNRDPLVTSGNTLAVEKDIPSSPYTSRASPALSLDDEDLFFTSSKSGFQPASTLSQWEPHPYNPPKTTSKIPTSTPAQRVSYVNPNPYGSSRFGQGTRPLASALGGMSSQSSRGGSSYGSGVSSASSKRKMPASFKSGGSVPKRSSFGKSFGGGHHGRPGRGHQNNKPAEYRPTLSNEQQRVLNMVLNDQQSIFFTGSAGTGKSVLMRALIEALMDKYGPDAVAVTASTGIAACNINGSTLHSFSGIGLGTETVHKLIEKVKYSKRACQRWKRTRVLIIDEISMVDGELFDKLEAIARSIRADNPGQRSKGVVKPFGGIQLVVTGDFFQLPPVNPHGPTKFAFEASTWSKVIQKTIVLTHVFRQKDQRFVDILNEMRTGRLTPASIELFRSLSRPLPESKIQAAELYPLRRDVETSNISRLNALNGDAREFAARDTGDSKKVESCIAPKQLRLKPGAQVMLLKNLDSSLVNGSLGVVAGFAGSGRFTTKKAIRQCLMQNRNRMSGEDTTEDDINTILDLKLPIVEFTNGREIAIEMDSWSIELPGGEVIASRTQVPLMLAWAMSIHKSQGQTLERVRVDLGESFEDGMAYVALSRATSLETLQILNFNPIKVTANRRVVAFYDHLQQV